MGNQGPVGNLLRERIRAERERRGLSIAQVAEAMTKRHRVTAYPSTISKIETGVRHARADEMIALAEIFGMTIDALAGRATTGIDATWAANRLANNAEKAASEVRGVKYRIASDLSDVVYYAESRGTNDRLGALISAGGDAQVALTKAGAALTVLANQFPMPGRVNR